jgi:hypothetical protein
MSAVFKWLAEHAKAVAAFLAIFLMALLAEWTGGDDVFGIRDAFVALAFALGGGATVSKVTNRARYD